MNALIVYDSQFGNTERIALRITSTLSEFGQARRHELFVLVRYTPKSSRV